MKALFIGECMVEFSPLKEGFFQRSFAGDSFNAAVYMKRVIGDEGDISYLTAIGRDQISQDMEACFTAEGIGTDSLLRSAHGTVGLYMISTDATGERSFSYWRENSIARRMMYLMKEAGRALIDDKTDLIFFSGISLAVLDTQSRSDLLTQLAVTRSAGTKIVFDPNYRPRLWEDAENARSWINKAYQVSDIVFPGLDEEDMLFGTATPEDCLDRIAKLGCGEIILKAGDQGMYIKSGAQRVHREFVGADDVVDTTAAGDSFDGAYLAARQMGQNLEQSLAKAADIAALVVAYPGALIPKGVI